jgi:two-component system cell cycle response regulator
MASFLKGFGNTFLTKWLQNKEVRILIVLRGKEDQVQGKILIIDPISTNRIMLKVKLMQAFYRILQANTVDEALRMARSLKPDLIISAVELPDGTSADLCRQMQKDPLLCHTPVLAIGTAPDTDTRLSTIAAGAMDLMNKPLDDALFLARVRSLVRGKHAAAEWQMRDDTSRALGMADPMIPFAQAGRTMLICQDMVCAQSWARILRKEHCANISVSLPGDVLRHIQEDNIPDAFVLVLPAARDHSGDALRLVANLRANMATRHAGIQTSGDPATAADALDLGADDLMISGFDAAELTVRLKSLIGRKQVAAHQRDQVRTGLQAAVFDELTGLHNRRYAMPYLSRIAEQARGSGLPFAVMLADLDHFKSINDDYGHSAGDQVLIECAQRFSANLREMDLLARIGGEEFLIVMPATSLLEARKAAQRLCEDMSAKHFNIGSDAQQVNVTVSIGLTIGGLSPVDTPETANSLLEQADKALYSAKLQGRNQVTLSRPAA